MKLKNKALEKLYGTIVNSTITISPFSESPIDKAFRECDEKIQKDIDIWKCGNDILISANSDLASIKKKLEKEIEGLKEHVLENHKIITDISSERDALEKERDNWRARAKYAEDEVERLRKAHDELFNAGSRKISEVRRENEAVNKKLEKDLTDAKVQLHFLTHSRDDWKRRVEHAEDEVEALKKDNEDLEKRLMETTETLDKVNSDRTELQKDRDYYYELYTKLRKDYDKLFEENRKLKARTDCLRYEVEWYRKHYKEQSDKISELKTELDELTSQYQKLSIENNRLQDGIPTTDAAISLGQTDLWVKLQNVRDIKPEEFDPECETLGDILDMDLEDFLDVYKKWWEQKEIDRMRTWLADFCVGRLCKECPLGSHEYKCGCGYSFKKRDRFDLRIISDEDIKRYYEKANGCGRYPFVKPDDPCSGIHEKIKEACDAFSEGLKAGLASEVKEVPVSCDIPIKDLGSLECTIEGNFEINKDLLEKVCGVKPKEEKSKPGELVITTRGVTTANYTEATMNAIKEAVRKFEKSLPALDSWESTITGSIKVDDILGKTDDTEHKLEYGDAVRLPWRDYDYMYIGPYKESKTLVRMFDPKMHAMVTSHIGNVKYNGGKIVICDEEDLRKIWKDKE